MESVASLAIIAVGVLGAVQVYGWASDRYSTDHAVGLAGLTLGWTAFVVMTLNHSDEDGTLFVTLVGITSAYGVGWFVSGKYGDKWGAIAAGVTLLLVAGLGISAI